MLCWQPMDGPLDALPSVELGDSATYYLKQGQGGTSAKWPKEWYGARLCGRRACFWVLVKCSMTAALHRGRLVVR